jgi:hypothetical protein
MKIVISSKELASKLNEIDFEEEYVIRVNSEMNRIIIKTKDNNYNIDCVVSESNTCVNQFNNNWNWLKKLVNDIDEQPIVLELFDHILNIIISY